MSYYLFIYYSDQNITDKLTYSSNDNSVGYNTTIVSVQWEVQERYPQYSLMEHGQQRILQEVENSLEVAYQACSKMRTVGNNIVIGRQSIGGRIEGKEVPGK